MSSQTSFGKHTGIGALALLVAMLSQNVGASFAKHLFPVVGAAGMTALRTALAAAMLLLIRRAWRNTPAQGQVVAILRYGAMLGVMNLLIYQAFSRIPIGIAVAIEVLGPLSVVLLSARRAADFVWLIAAMLGLALLLPLQHDSKVLDPLGVVCAIGAACSWALYIIFGKSLSTAQGVDGVAWGMAVAALVTVPFGIHAAGSALLSPPILLTGLVIAALSSALPYTLEMFSLRRLPAHVFSILVSAAPAVAAMAGFAVLGERLLGVQWAAIVLIMFAAAGSTISSRRRQTTV